MIKKLSKVHYVLPPDTEMKTCDFDLELKPLIPERDQVHEIMRKIFGEKVEICAYLFQGPSLGEMFDEYYKKKAVEKAARKAAG